MRLHLGSEVGGISFLGFFFSKAVKGRTLYFFGDRRILKNWWGRFIEREKGFSFCGGGVIHRIRNNYA